MTPDLARLTPGKQLRGHDDEETAKLTALLERAKTWISDHEWCESIIDDYYAFGIGDIVGIFLLHLKISREREGWAWVIVGDLPSAYVVADDAETPKAALVVYCELMQDWVNAVREGKDLASVYPVGVTPNEKHASMLESRVKVLMECTVHEIE